MKIWNVPIESLEERYSADWNHWFPLTFDEHNVEYETVYGEELTNKIEQGSFLDAIGTNYFKASQIQKLCKLLYERKIKDEDIIFFHDLWFPGIESLAYIRDALDLKFKIVGILHAGTWDEYDFLSKKGMTKWAENLENSWFQFIDAIFVATNFHKNLIDEQRDVKCPIHVTGLPIYPTCYKRTKKEKIIVFPHRLDSEKQPEEFDRLERECKKLSQFKDWQFVKTKEVTKTKKEYYNLLNRSSIAISFALQETWGIAVQEALFCNCVPFVPDRLSYKEMYPSQLQFSSLEELIHKLNVFLFDPLNFSFSTKLAKENLKYKGANAIGKMITLLRS